jgi:hypothetical protein
MNRKNEPGQRTRQKANRTIALAARMTGPGHPANRQASTRTATSRSSTGCRARNLSTTWIARIGWTIVITQPACDRWASARQAGRTGRIIDLGQLLA